MSLHVNVDLLDVVGYVLLALAVVIAIVAEKSGGKRR